MVENRKTYIDFVKMVAIFMVLYNHTGEKGFFLFANRVDSIFYPLYLFTSIIIKVAVPLFLMASGALLLRKEETIHHLICKRFVRHFITLVLSSGVVYTYLYFRGAVNDFSVGSFVKNLYTGKISPHFWFMYTYLAYLLMLPLLRKISRILDKKDYRWIMLMVTIIQLIPLAEFVVFNGDLSINNNFRFFITSNVFLYPLIGYHVDESDYEEIQDRLGILMFFSCLSLAITCFTSHYYCLATGNWNESSGQVFFNNLVFLPSATIFCITKLYFHKSEIPNKMKSIISAVGDLTFGIYLLEPIYRRFAEPVYFFLEPVCGSFFACIMWILAACICGGLITYLMKELPGINKLI